MDTLEALYTRRSVRQYKPEPVEKSLIERCIDAGRLAASANNLQPWDFVVVTEESLRRKLTDLCEHGKFIVQAPVCIAVFCRATKYYLEDGCAATQNILVAAHAQGLGTCWIAGDKKEHAEPIRELLGAPPGFKLVSLIALGHAAESPVKPKRPLREVLHWEKF